MLSYTPFLICGAQWHRKVGWWVQRANRGFIKGSTAMPAVRVLSGFAVIASYPASSCLPRHLWLRHYTQQRQTPNCGLPANNLRSAETPVAQTLHTAAADTKLWPTSHQPTVSDPISFPDRPQPPYRYFVSSRRLKLKTGSGVRDGFICADCAATGCQ